MQPDVSYLDILSEEVAQLHSGHRDNGSVDEMGILKVGSGGWEFPLPGQSVSWSRAVQGQEEPQPTSVLRCTDASTA